MRKTNVLLIGGSAGSLDVLFKFLPTLDPNLNFPLILVVHRKSGKEELLTQLLASKTQLKVKEAQEKEVLESGTLYIAPPGYHLLIEKDHTLSLDSSEKINFSRPSIDVSFESAAAIYGSGTIGLLLSGANADGTQGLKCIQEKGGFCIVQDPTTAKVPFMPLHASTMLTVDRVLKPQQMAQFINSLN